MRELERGPSCAVSARNRELLALVPASLLADRRLRRDLHPASDDALGRLADLRRDLPRRCASPRTSFLRFTLPYADPYLFPLVAVLACFGLVVIYRIDEELAREQAQWFVVGLALFAATIVLLRDFRVLERYRYTIALAASLLLLPAARAGHRRSRSTAPTSASSIGPISFQPAEFGEDRDRHLPGRATCATRARCWCQGARRVARGDVPPLKHFGPLLVVWGAAMLLLVFIRDLGSSLMFFGGFLALLYVATNRLSFVAIGHGAVRASARGSSPPRSATSRTASTSGSTRSTPSLESRTSGYQIAQSLFAQADGGLFGTGFGAGAAATRRAATPLIPRAADRPHLRGDHQRARPGRRLRAAARLPADRRARLQDRDARARTRSPSCWPPGSPRCSRCRCS